MYVVQWQTKAGKLYCTAYRTERLRNERFFDLKKNPFVVSESITKYRVHERDALYSKRIRLGDLTNKERDELRGRFVK